MTKEEQLARLLRLKRYEKPDTDYFAGFLDEFHDYQRKAVATQSAASLWWERVCTTFSALRRPSTAWAAVGAYATVMLLIYTWPAPDHARPTTVVVAGDASALPVTPRPPAPSRTPDSFQSWQTAIPAGQTQTVSDTPGLQPPVTGKRRTADQPQDLPKVNGAPPSAEPPPKRREP